MRRMNHIIIIAHHDSYSYADSLADERVSYTIIVNTFSIQCKYIKFIVFTIYLM